MINMAQERIEGSLDNSEIFAGAVLKRDGTVVDFQFKRIEMAVEKAFRADLQLPSEQDLDAFTQKETREISNTVTEQIAANPKKRQVTIEEIQDLVEVTLMQFGYYSVAKRYILYRSERAKIREAIPSPRLVQDLRKSD